MADEEVDQTKSSWTRVVCPICGWEGWKRKAIKVSDAPMERLCPVCGELVVEKSKKS